MKLSSQQLPSGKWGIYSDTELLATVNSQAICETIMANLATGRRDAPFDDVNALYQVPELRNKTAQSAGPSPVTSARQGTQSVFGNASSGKKIDSKGADSKALKAAQVSAKGAVKQQTGKTAKKQAATPPLKGRAKARANGSAKRKRRSTSRTNTSLAS